MPSSGACPPSWRDGLDRKTLLGETGARPYASDPVPGGSSPRDALGIVEVSKLNARRKAVIRFEPIARHHLVLYFRGRK